MPEPDVIQEEIIVEVPAPTTDGFEGEPLPTMKKRGVTSQTVDRDNGGNTTDSNRFVQN